MALRIITAAFLVLATHAGESGPFASGPGQTPAGLEISTNAGRNPNSISSVNFSRMFNGTEEDWTWRINITDFAMPDGGVWNLGEEDADYSEGLRVVNTQWELHWPGSDEGDNFGEWLADRGWEGIRVLTRISNLSNLTEEYSDYDEGDCAPIFGEECAASLAGAVMSGGSTSNLAGCDDSAVGGFSFEVLVGSGADSYQHGDTLYFSSSPSFTANETDEIELAEGALHVLMMAPLYGASVGGVQDSGTVLCRIVNPQAAQDQDLDEEDLNDETSNEEDSDDMENIATDSRQLPMKYVFGSLMALSLLYMA